MQDKRTISMIEREPRFVHVLQDIWRIVFFLSILGVDVAAVVLLPKVKYVWLDMGGRVFALLAAHLLFIMILRELVPRPPVGSQRVGKDKAYVRWLVASAYSNVVNSLCFSGPFQFLHLTRYMYFRAQGAEVKYGASIHASVRVRAPSLFVVESGAQLEPGVVVENAVHAMGRVRIETVTIREGALVGAHALLMPGCTIGPNARVGPGAYVGPDVCVGVGAKLGERAVLAAGVDLGSYVRIGAGAVIAEGVSIGDNAKIRAGSVIPPSTRIRGGEVWQGLAARPVFRDKRHGSDGMSNSS